MVHHSGLVRMRALSRAYGRGRPNNSSTPVRQQIKLLQRCCHCRCEAEEVKASGEGNTVAREFAAGLVDQFITSGMIVAVDSGDYCTGMIQEIGSRMDAGNLQGVRIIASCDAAASEAAFVGVPQAMSADASKIDVMFSEADEVDVADPELSFVFGRRSEPAQPQIPRFRAAAAKTDTFVAILASEEQAVDRLGRDLPVLVDGDKWEEAGEALDDLFIGDAEIWRRSATPGEYAGPDGGVNPYVAADGSALLDVKFYGDFCLVEDKTVPYEKIVQEIMAAPGARSVGLLAGVATHVALFTREAENHLKVFSKEELITAAASAAEVAAAAAELAGDLDA